MRRLSLRPGQSWVPLVPVRALKACVGRCALIAIEQLWLDMAQGRRLCLEVSQFSVLVSSFFLGKGVARGQTVGPGMPRFQAYLNQVSLVSGSYVGKSVIAWLSSSYLS